MKIAVISSTIFSVPLDGYGGLEMIAWECARGLALLGHKVTLMAPNGSVCPGVDVFGFGDPGKVPENFAFEKYKNLLPKFDAIIDHSWQKWALSARIDGTLKSPVLSVMHAPVNTMFGTMPDTDVNLCFVGISNDMCRQFDGLFNKTAKCCWNGTDIDFYKPIQVPKSNRYLFLARFSTIKGPEIAIDVCNDLKLELDLIGDTSITNEPEYFERCANKCDGTRIRMVGPKSRGECVYWFSQAKCMLHPNKFFREPYGLAPIESQLCGTPVVAFDSGAMRETIKVGETGFIVKTIKEFTELLQKDATRDLKPERCREWASQFSVQNMCKRYETLCQEAIETGGW